MIERVGGSVANTIEKSIQLKEVQELSKAEKEKNVGSEQEVQNLQEEMYAIKEEDMQRFVEDVNEVLIPSKRHVQFEYHDDLNEYYVVVVDDESKEVVREVPSKKLMDMYAAMNEFIGLLFDKKA